MAHQTGFILPCFKLMQLVATLGDNVAKSNFVQLKNDFAGLGVEGGMLLQGTLMNFNQCFCTSLDRVLSHLQPQYTVAAKNKTKNKPEVRQGLASAVHFGVATENTTNQWSQLFTY